MDSMGEEPLQDDPRTDKNLPSKLSRSVPRLLFELVVVFIGVWAAFFVEAERERRDAESRAARILEVIQLELSDNHEWHEEWTDSVNAERELWKERREAGEQITPFFVRIPGSETPSRAAWEAALASDALRVLDPDLVRRIGNFYSERAGLGPRIQRYMAQTELLVLSSQADGPAVFFDPETGDYFSQYQGNMALMDEVLSEMDRMFEWGSELSSGLQIALGPLQR